MSWTDERVEVLKALWADGASASAIAKRLGVTRNAVIGKVHRLDLPARAPTPERFRKAKTGDMASARAPKKRAPAMEFHGISIAKRTPNPLGWRAKRIKPKVMPKPRPPRPAAPVRRNIGLLELTAASCRWPVNDPPRGEPYLFCGAAVEEPRVYCSDHYLIAYQRGSAPRRPELGGWTPREEAA